GKPRAPPPAQEAVVPEAARHPLEGDAGAGAAWQGTCAATGGGQKPGGGLQGPPLAGSTAIQCKKDGPGRGGGLPETCDTSPKNITDARATSCYPLAQRMSGLY